MLLLVTMHFTVKLDCEASFHAAEVSDERADGVLTPKLQPSQTAPAQRFPKEILSIGFPSPQLTRRRYVVGMRSRTVVPHVSILR